MCGKRDIGEIIDNTIERLKQAYATSNTWPVPLKERADEVLAKAQDVKAVWSKTKETSKALDASESDSVQEKLAKAQIYMEMGNNRVEAAGEFGKASGRFLDAYFAAK